MCTIQVGAPADGVISLFAEELRRNQLRVDVAADGRSIRAKTRLALALNLIQILHPVELFFSPVLTITLLEEGRTGTAFEVGTRSERSHRMSPAVPDALNRSITTLCAQGVAVDVGPWERWFRGKRVPV